MTRHRLEHWRVRGRREWQDIHIHCELLYSFSIQLVESLSNRSNATMGTTCRATNRKSDPLMRRSISGLDSLGEGVMIYKKVTKNRSEIFAPIHRDSLVLMRGAVIVFSGSKTYLSCLSGITVPFPRQETHHTSARNTEFDKYRWSCLIVRYAQLR